jgi:transcription elongation GreA/GreB family factor
MLTNLELKEKLFDHCLQYVDERISRAKTAMHAAQASANSESKSSAGDKYETGRAMMQIERDKNAILLAEAQKLKQAMSLINPHASYDEVQLGSLVFTDNGDYYFSISLGNTNIDNREFTCLSPGSPLGQAFLGKRIGDKVVFNKRMFTITSID